MKRTAASHQSHQKRPHAPISIVNYLMLSVITKDAPEMAEAALKTFMDAEKGKVFLLVTVSTVAEAVWVLESFYGYSKESDRPNPDSILIM